MEEITVGIFWICDRGKDLEIIYDIENLPSNSQDENITYMEAHCNAWDKLATIQFNGRYMKYQYDDFPRGRIWYNTKTKKRSINYDYILKNHLTDFKSELEKIFKLDDVEYIADESYASLYGRYHKRWL